MHRSIELPEFLRLCRAPHVRHDHPAAFTIIADRKRPRTAFAVAVREKNAVDTPSEYLAFPDAEPFVE